MSTPNLNRSIPLALVICFGLAFIQQASAQTALPVATPSATPADPAMYLPQASVLVTSTTAAPTASSAKAGGQPAAAAALPASLEICVPDAFSITSVTPEAHTATVTLTYNALCTGMKVLVAPLDGGVVNGSVGSKQMLVGADGTAVFTYQTPNAVGLYNVLVVLGGYQRVLPFQMLAAPSTSGN